LSLLKLLHFLAFTTHQPWLGDIHTPLNSLEVLAILFSYFNPRSSSVIQSCILLGLRYSLQDFIIADLELLHMSFGSFSLLLEPSSSFCFCMFLFIVRINSSVHCWFFFLLYFTPWPYSLGWVFTDCTIRLHCCRSSIDAGSYSI